MERTPARALSNVPELLVLEGELQFAVRAGGYALQIDDEDLAAAVRAHFASDGRGPGPGPGGGRRVRVTVERVPPIPAD
jgi:hypothetical protein